jgi:hypothetical protein
MAAASITSMAAETGDGAADGSETASSPSRRLTFAHTLTVCTYALSSSYGLSPRPIQYRRAQSPRRRQSTEGRIVSARRGPRPPEYSGAHGELQLVWTGAEPMQLIWTDAGPMISGAEDEMLLVAGIASLPANPSKEDEYQLVAPSPAASGAVESLLGGIDDAGANETLRQLVGPPSEQLVPRRSSEEQLVPRGRAERRAESAELAELVLGGLGSWAATALRTRLRNLLQLVRMRMVRLHRLRMHRLVIPWVCMARVVTRVWAAAARMVCLKVWRAAARMLCRGGGRPARREQPRALAVGPGLVRLSTPSSTSRSRSRTAIQLRRMIKGPGMVKGACHVITRNQGW